MKRKIDTQAVQAAGHSAAASVGDQVRDAKAAAVDLGHAASDAAAGAVHRLGELVPTQPSSRVRHLVATHRAQRQTAGVLLLTALGLGAFVSWRRSRQAQSVQPDWA